MTMMSVEELIETFSFVSDWEERYQILIDLGGELPEMPEDQKNDQSLVKGCTSRVWIVPKVDEKGRFDFMGDSDAHIVKGLVAVLMIIYKGVPVTELKNIDAEGVFKQLGLEEHLTPNRRNGFYAMVERIKTYA